MSLLGSFAMRRSTILASSKLPRPQIHRRRLASDASKDSIAVAESSSEVTAKAALLANGQVQRHGPGDAVILLNVGGKDFCTLRSTVAANEVLRKHVGRAEANQEFTHGGTSVFVDRDPTHFHLILNHLRNKVEGLSYYHSKKGKKSNQYHVQLPKDLTALRDIYVEAQHYGIHELQSSSCEQNVIVKVMKAFGGKSGNPFDKAEKLFQQLRRGLMAFGSMSTVAIGSQQDHGKFLSQLFPAWFPNKEEKADDNAKSKSGESSASVAA